MSALKAKTLMCLNYQQLQKDPNQNFSVISQEAILFANALLSVNDWLRQIPSISKDICLKIGQICFEAYI